jgi:hypothetical protein
MRPQDIKINNYYRLKSQPNYSYVKVLKVLKPKQEENNTTYTVIRVEHVINKNDDIGFIRRFRPCDLLNN